MEVLMFGLGLSGLAINNLSKPLTPQGMCQTLQQKHSAVVIVEKKLLLITYDLRGSSSLITNLGYREFWRQNPNFGHGHPDKKDGFFPWKEKHGTLMFQEQTKGYSGKGRPFFHLKVQPLQVFAAALTQLPGHNCPGSS